MVKGTTNTSEQTADNKPKELTKRQQFRAQEVLLIAAENPKKKGSQSFDRFKGYFKFDYSKKLPTVNELMDKGVRMDDIRHDSEHGFIAVGDKAIKEYRTRAEREHQAAVASAKKLLESEGMKVSG